MSRTDLIVGYQGGHTQSRALFICSVILFPYYYVRRELNVIDSRTAVLVMTTLVKS